MFSQDQMNGLHRHGKKFQTTWRTANGVRVLLTSVGRVALVLVLTHDRSRTIRIEVRFDVLETRNDRGLESIEMSLPRCVYNEFPEELRLQQHSNLASRAHWQHVAPEPVWRRLPEDRDYSPSSPDRPNDRPSTLNDGAAAAPGIPSRESAAEVRFFTPHTGHPFFGHRQPNVERVFSYDRWDTTTGRRTRRALNQGNLPGTVQTVPPPPEPSASNGGATGVGNALSAAQATLLRLTS